MFLKAAAKHMPLGQVLLVFGLIGATAFALLAARKGEAVFQTYGLPCMEVTEEVFESPASRVFDQAENRLHAIKAILVATMGP